MLDHIGLRTTRPQTLIAFYAAALAPLGYKTLMTFDGVAGLGEADHPDLWVGEHADAGPHMHLAFRTTGRDAVDGFYAAAMANGATDNGPPGVRPHYHATYYAAFVLDPDGNNLEVVCHVP